MWYEVMWYNELELPEHIASMPSRASDTNWDTRETWRINSNAGQVAEER